MMQSGIGWRKDTARFRNGKEHDGVKYPSECHGYRKATGKPRYVREIVDLRSHEEPPEGLPE